MPLFSLFIEGIGGSLVLIGLVIFGREVTGTFGRIPLGSLSDKYGRKTLLIIGTGGYAISPLIYSLINQAGYLIPFALFHGITVACIWPTAFATLSDMTKVGKRGQAIGLFSVFTGTGYASGIIIGGLVSKSYGFEFTYQIAFIIGVIGFLSIVIGFKETNPKTNRTNSTKSDGKSFLEQFKLLKTPMLLIAAISGMAGSLTLGMGATFFPLYGAQVELTEAQIGFVLMLVPMIGNVVSFPIGKIADIIDKRILLFSIIFLGIVLVGSIPFFESFLAFIFIFSLLSITDMAIQIVPITIVADTAEIPDKGMGIGMIQTSNHTGKAISPLLFSILAGTGVVNLAYSFWVSSLISGILLIIMIIMAKRTKSTTST